MKILVQDEDGVRELEEGYASEQELQTFLRDHSELMPVDEIELGTPPLLCIGWEVSVASGSEDLLYIDETALLTLVETKLRRNPEARREVVGQILEYAAQASAWAASDIEMKAQKFLSSPDCPEEYRGLTLEEALRRFLEKTNSPTREAFIYEDFLHSVAANLERGHIRLVIAIDEPPPPLLATVEFINRFSEHFEMYLIQLKRFHDGARGENIFVPALFGRVERRGPRGPWNEQTFLDQASKEAPAALPILRQLIDFGKAESAILWGRGPKLGSFQFVFTDPDGRRVPAFYVAADGRMTTDFWTLSKWLKAELVASYRDRLARAEDIPRAAITTATWKEFEVTALGSRRSWEAFKRAVLALKRAVQNQL